MARWPKFLSFRRRRGSRSGENGSGKKERFTRIRDFFAEQSLRLLRWGIAVLMLIVLFLLARPSGSSYLRGLKEGSVPNRTIKAAFEFQYVDTEATKARREEAASRVPPVYEELPDVKQEISGTYARFVDLVAEMPTERSAIGAWIGPVERELNIKLDNRPYNKVTSGTETVSEGTWSTLARYKDYKSFWSTVGMLIDRQLRFGIVDDRAPIDNAKTMSDLSIGGNREIGILRIEPGNQQSRVLNTDEIRTLDEFYTYAAETLRSKYFPREDEAALRQLATDILQAIANEPNLVYLGDETKALREKARAKVEPVMVHVDEGMRLVTDGVRIGSREAMMLQSYGEIIGLSWVSEMGILILAFATTVVIIAYLRKYHRILARDPRQLGVVLLIFVLVLALARTAAYLTRLSPDLELIGFAVPIGALGVLITLLASGRLAAFLVAMASVYAGLILGGDTLEYDLRFTLVGLWSGATAILAVHQLRQRSDLYRAGLLVSIVSVVAIVALHFLKIQDFDELRVDSEQLRQLRWAAGWGLVNGGLVFMLSTATLPWFEDLLGVTTDIKLLELGQKTPLLHRLEREAPGSYQHTMVVATLAESAAEAINANALLTRVGAYYHDIGKMQKPAYFTENQQTAADKTRHAKLKPQMSVLVIKNHVKYGLELAREYKLPKIIQNFIPEHHGTTLISYFYHQVLANSPPDSVREEDFRYPGPKPRSKETAILMIADSVEAVSRTLTEPNEGQIRSTVQKIVNDRFFDGQFDECNLTMADLKKLVDSFSESLTHMLHQRIKYPPRPAPRMVQSGGGREEMHPERVGAA